MSKAINELELLDTLFLKISVMDTQEIMKVDSLWEAEKITGESYKTSDKTSSLGFLIMQEVSKREKVLLESENDTGRGTTIPEFKAILSAEGFEEIYKKQYSKKEDYTYSGGKSIPYERISHLYCWWNKELNILIECTTYPSQEVVNDELIIHDETINSAKMNYTLKLKDDLSAEDKDLSWRATSSGGMNKDGTYTGDHDIRKGFRSNLNNLKKYYNFVEWSGEQFLWLLHYSQTEEEGYDNDEINRSVIAEFPKHVTDIMSDKYYSAVPTLSKIKEKLCFAYYGWGIEDIDDKSIDGWFEDMYQIRHYSVQKALASIDDECKNRSNFITWFNQLKEYKEAKDA